MAATIPSHRTGAAVVTLVGADGARLAGATATVRQVRHAFGFGNIGFDLVPLANGEATPGLEGLADRWLELFNVATLPFYWARFEPERGRPDTERLRRAAAWFVERGVAVKGHPLLWHTLAPSWLLGLPEAEVEAVARARITRDVTAFRDLVHAWDVINEAVIMPVFENGDNAITPLCRRLGRVETVRLAFDTARAADPGATLLLNDFDLSADYERLIEACLDAGVRIDALGLQSHMHQGYWGEARTLETIERFARFGLPLHWTETSLVSGQLMPPEIVDLNDYRVDAWPSTPEGEARQADELVRHYRTLVGHPAVAAVTYWGITDDGAWLGAPIGLVRADGSAKPAFDALRALIGGEWWLAETPVTADADGRVQVEGFAGTYEVRAGGAGALVEVAAGTTTEAGARLA